MFTAINVTYHGWQNFSTPLHTRFTFQEVSSTFGFSPTEGYPFPLRMPDWMANFRVPHDLENPQFSVETILGPQVSSAGRHYSILWVEAVCDDEEAGKRWRFTQTCQQLQTYFLLMFFLADMPIILVFQQQEMIEDACSFCAWSMTLVSKRFNPFTWSESTNLEKVLAYLCFFSDLTVCQLIDRAVWAGTSM